MKTCRTLITAGTIISWVPRPSQDAPTNVYFNDDTWIECNGADPCKSGDFEGQFCADLSDRVLVGAGKLGQLLDLKDASLPDHAHQHRVQRMPSLTEITNWPLFLVENEVCFSGDRK